MKKFVVFLLFFILITAAVSCSSDDSAVSSESRQSSGPVGAPAMDSSFNAQEPAFSKGSSGSSETIFDEGSADQTDRLIIKSGSISLTVPDIPEALDSVEKTAGWLGGFVVSSNWYGGEKESSATISIRVPAEKFTEAMEAVRGIALEVILETTDASDVTEEFTDLESQLRNLKVTENRYLELVAKADTVEDIIKIERVLSETRGRIEDIQGRIQFLERSSATSLISILLIEEGELEVDFTADRIEIEETTGIYFSNETAGGSAPYGYSWDFGDGKSSQERNPYHVYDDDGRYTISLTVIDSKKNTATEVKEEYINVLAGPGWNAGGTVKSAWRGVLNIGRVLGTLVIWIAILAIIWIPVLVIIYWIRRRKKKISNK